MSTCPNCHAPLPPDAPEGLCPQCLLNRALEPNSLPTHQNAEIDNHISPHDWTPPAPADLAAFFPELDLLELLGRGGMGAVYKARQKSLDRLVALKILPPQISARPGFAGRFTNEAHAMARLSHPHIVTIYDFGTRNSPFGPQSLGASVPSPPLHYFLMEYIDGLTLRQVLHAGELASRDALAIVPQICDALQYAHDRGIVHRDIKPENILITRAGDIKIADFGLAKLIAPMSPSTTGLEVPPSTQDSGRTTQDSFIAGTPAYMAPEQSATPAAVDHRADIYAVGVVFYQLLTGELPPRDPTRLQPPSRKVHIDVRLDEIVLRALERDPARRYASATELKTEVETVLSTPATPPVTPPAKPPAIPPAMPPAAPPVSQPVPAPMPFTGPAGLSRIALLGAAWLPWLFIAFFLYFTATSTVHRTSPIIYNSPEAALAAATGQPSIFQMIFFTFLAILGLSSPIGATTCGIVSTLQIRRSNGRLYGLPLALLDLLFYPLLALDALFTFIIHYIFIYIRAFTDRGFGPWSNDVFTPLEILLILAFCLLIDTLLIWLAWRITRIPSPASPKPRPAGSPPAAAPQPATRPRHPVPAYIVSVLLLVMLEFLFLYIVAHFREVFRDFRASLPALTEYLFALERLLTHAPLGFFLCILLAVAVPLPFLLFDLLDRTNKYHPLRRAYRIVVVAAFSLVAGISLLGLGLPWVKLVQRVKGETPFHPRQLANPASFLRSFVNTLSPAQANADGLLFFNLADARTVAPPFPIKITGHIWSGRPLEGYSFIRITPTLQDWAALHGIDLVFHLQKDQWAWQSLQATIRDKTSFPTLDYESLTLPDALDALARPRLNWQDPNTSAWQDNAYVRHVATWYPYTGKPVVALFKTRAGAVGVLQMTPDPAARAITLRHKILRPATPAEAAPPQPLPEPLSFTHPSQLLDLLPADARPGPRGWDEFSKPKADKWLEDNIPPRYCTIAFEAAIRSVAIKRISPKGNLVETLRWDVELTLERTPFDFHGTPIALNLDSYTPLDPNNNEHPLHMTQSVVTVSGDEALARRARDLLPGDRITIAGTIGKTAIWEKQPPELWVLVGEQSTTFPPLPAFLPPVDITLHDLESPQANALRLQDAMVIPLPPDFGRRTPAAREQWLAANHIDLLADFARNRWALMSRDVSFGDLPNTAFDAPTYAPLAQSLIAGSTSLQKSSTSEGTFFLLPLDAQFPLTFAFRTASERGLFQIAPTSDNQRLHLRIRALAPSPATLPSATGPER